MPAVVSCISLTSIDVLHCGTNCMFDSIDYFNKPDTCFVNSMAVSGVLNELKIHFGRQNL